LFGKLRGPFNKSLDSGTDSEVLMEVPLNDDIVRLVALSRINSEVNVSVSVSMTELNLLWLVKALQVIPLFLMQLAKEVSTCSL
jgi:hypothetical protein